MNPKRVRQLNTMIYQDGPILYWMSRDQRVRDNWALIFAQELAKKNNVPFGVIFNLVPDFLGGGLRQLDFKVKGLQEVEADLKQKNIPFFLLHEKKSEVQLLEFIENNKVGALVTDFSPLTICRQWIRSVNEKLNIPFYEVDAHNIVPCWIASEKQEFSARTIRPKIHSHLPEFLEEFPPVQEQRLLWPHFRMTVSTDWERVVQDSNVDRHVLPVSWIKPGSKAALKALKLFLETQLSNYAEARNDPSREALSNLSPYFHYGHLSPQRAALLVQNCDVTIKSQEVFLEEMIVRRELADNYCYFNPHYDRFEGFPLWAQKTLEEHFTDSREHIYSLGEFEGAQTHDELWNAAQMEMVKTGKMHGYMRMYWAKKILEWTKNPMEAQKIALYLNDKYELDGRDPNGYTGVAWSIGGVHDRPWFKRPIFGAIRYMSYNGCKSKFDIKAYVEKVMRIE